MGFHMILLTYHVWRASLALMPLHAMAPGIQICILSILQFWFFAFPVDDCCCVHALLLLHGVLPTEYLVYRVLTLHEVSLPL